MTSQAEVIAKMTAKASQQGTVTLCEALTMLEAKPKLDEAERMTRTVLIDVITARHPEADAAFDAWAARPNLDDSTRRRGDHNRRARGSQGRAASMITITHTHADGTLIEGSAKGDGVYEILKAQRDNWRYMPSIKRIGISQSRDRNADPYKIKRAAEALRAAGHEVTVSVDESARRTVAEIEADRAERAEARAERYEERSERVGASANADYERARSMAALIPFGQPAMPDHYSYRRDMNYRGKIDRTYSRAFEGMDQAEELQRRSGAAEANQAHRESVPATLRRIAKLEADERRLERDIAGRDDYELNDETGQYEIRLVKPGPAYMARLERALADVREKLGYWRGQVKAAEADGAKVWGPDDFAKGDYALRRGQWFEVVRVNAKSLSIPWSVNNAGQPVVTPSDSTYPRPIPYDDIRGRKSAEEIAAMLAESVA